MKEYYKLVLVGLVQALLLILDSLTMQRNLEIIPEKYRKEEKEEQVGK